MEFRRVVVRSGAEDSVEGSTQFNLRMHLSLPPDAYETLKVDLREMVTLRNTLVHHFIDQYDLWAVDGCLRAQDALNRTYAEIEIGRASCRERVCQYV